MKKIDRWSTKFFLFFLVVAGGTFVYLSGNCYYKRIYAQFRLSKIRNIENVHVSDDQCHTLATIHIRDRGDITFVDLRPEAFSNSSFMWIQLFSPQLTITPLKIRLDRIEESKKPEYPYGNRESLNDYRILPLQLHNVNEVISYFDEIVKSINNQDKIDLSSIQKGSEDYYFIY